jgi:hypothetical protein
MECEKCSFNFCDNNKKKRRGHERQYVITEAVLHICPVSQYKTEIEKKKKNDNGKEFVRLIIHVQIS